ncbi:MAG TPA: carboxypeptidase regulatory-like domain-containing protein [Kofleriaceae bacterium]|nr:carboxypeptidase regulatory-like domain-containing protein [Kofleriaceae bacterium]
MMRSTIKTGVFAALAMAAFGCGDSLEVKNTGPKGSVGGIIVDAVTRAPIEGASLSVLAGATTKGPTETDAQGIFRFTDVPAGDVLIIIDGPEGAAYTTAWIRAYLDDTAGDFPAHNTITLGPIGLVAGTTNFTMRVLDQTGRPVSQYPVTLRHFVEYVNFGNVPASGGGEVLVTGTTGTDGRVTFAGMPDFFSMSPSINDTVLLLLPPLQDGGVFEFAGGSQTMSMRNLGDPTPDVILDPAFETQLRVRASTVPALAGSGGTNPTATVLAINDVIHVAFNLPIRNNASVVISDERGTPIANQPTMTISDDNLTMSFGNDPLLPGAEYNIFIHAVSAVGDVNVTGDFVAAFFTPALTDDVTVTNINRDPNNQVVTIEFSEPVGIGQGQSVVLSGGNCVLFFNANLADITGAGLIGDAPNERGNGACDLALFSIEPDPTGPAGLSGYTRYWQFTAPPPAAGGALPAGTRFDILFSRVPNAGFLIERADGRPVRDFIAPNDIPINP